MPSWYSVRKALPHIGLFVATLGAVVLDAAKNGQFASYPEVAAAIVTFVPVILDAVRAFQKAESPKA